MQKQFALVVVVTAAVVGVCIVGVAGQTDLSDVSIITDEGIEVVTSGDVARSWAQGSREFSGTDASALFFFWSSPSGTEVDIDFDVSDRLVMNTPVVVGYDNEIVDQDFRRSVPTELSLFAVVHPCKLDGEVLVSMTITPASSLVLPLEISYVVVCDKIAYTLQVQEADSLGFLVLNGIVQPDFLAVAESGNDMEMLLYSPAGELVVTFFEIHTYDETSIPVPGVSQTAVTTTSQKESVRIAHSCPNQDSRTWITVTVNVENNGAARQAVTFWYVLECKVDNSQRDIIIISVVVVVVVLLVVAAVFFVRKRREANRVEVDKLDPLVAG